MHAPELPDAALWSPPGGQHTAAEIAQQPALWIALADAL